MKNGVTISLPELIALRFHAKKMALSHNRRKIANKSNRSGEHSALALGRGLEFSEVREYQHGDDIRTIDWRVTARTGKPHTKLYQEERERPLFIVVDDGPDMFFGTRAAFKSVIAAQAAALIAWSAIADHYRIGSLIFSGNQRVETKLKSGQQGVLELLKILADRSASSAKKNKSDPGQALMRLRQTARPGSTIILISDFSGFDKTAENHLLQLSLHCQVIAIFIYDPMEKNLPSAHTYSFANNTRQFSMLDCADSTVQKNYTAQFCEREAYLKKRLTQSRINFLPLATNDNLVETLSRGFLGILK